MKFFSSPLATERGAWQRRLFSAPIILLIAVYASFFVFAFVQACNPYVDVIPSVDCVVKNANGTYIAYFGFKNIYKNQTYAFTIPAGGSNPKNYINTSGKTTLNSYLPSKFPYIPTSDGILHNSVKVVFDGSPITWYIGNFQVSASASTPSCGPTTTTVTTAPNPSVLGQTVFISAKVQGPTLPGSQSGTTVTPPPVIFGNVTFSTGSTVLGSGVVQPDGSASISTANFAGGANGSNATYPIIATYAGNYAGSSSGVVNQVVEQVSPVLECVDRNSNGSYRAHFGYNNQTSSPIDVVAGPQNSFNPASYSVPITHFLAGRQVDQFQIDFTSTVVLVWNLTSHTSTASINSHGCNGVGSTTTTVATTPNPTYLGQNVTISANVIGYNGGGSTLTGTITFIDGTISLDTSPVDANGNASIQTTSLAVGTHPITATYSGSGIYTASTSGIVNQVVNKIPTTAVAISSLPSSVVGQKITFSAIVTPSYKIPTTMSGMITFKDGSTFLGANPIDSLGHAVFTSTNLTVSSHTITASYSGDTNYLASSGVTLQNVTTIPIVMTGNTNAFIRVVQSSSAYSSTDVSVDGATTYPNLEACSIGNYAPVTLGNHTFTVTDSSGTSSNQLASKTINFTAGNYYTVVVIGNPTLSPAVASDLVVVQDDLSIASGKAKVRVYHFSDISGPISVGIDSSIIIPSLSFTNASTYSQQNPVVTNFVVTLLNSPADQVTDALSLTANQVYSIFVICGGQTSNQVLSGLPVALPQTGVNPTVQASTTAWWMVVIVMGLLPFIGGGIGWGAARVVIAQRRRQ